MYLKKNLVLCHVLGHFQIFCFKCTYSKAKQLRIVLRNGITPDFLEIHLLEQRKYKAKHCRNVLGRVLRQKNKLHAPSFRHALLHSQSLKAATFGHSSNAVVQWTKAPLIYKSKKEVAVWV